jgi:hypothetical protein
VSDETLRASGPEGPSTPEEEYGLEQRCLAGAVVAPDEVQSRMQGELRPLDAAQVLDRQIFEARETQAGISAADLEAHRHHDVLRTR